MDKIKRLLHSIDPFRGSSGRTETIIVDADVMHFITTSSIAVEFKCMLGEHQIKLDWLPGSSTAVLTSTGQQISKEEEEEGENEREDDCENKQRSMSDTVYSCMTRFMKHDIQLPSELWTEISDKLPIIRGEFGAIIATLQEINNDCTAIRLICRKPVFKHLEEKIKVHLKEITESVTRERLFRNPTKKFLMEQRKFEVESIENELKKFHIQIEKGLRDENFEITGKSRGVELAREKLETLASKVSKKTISIDQPGILKLILHGKAKAIVRSVEREHQCAVVVEQKVTCEADGAPAEQRQGDPPHDFHPDDVTRRNAADANDGGTLTTTIRKCRISWRAEELTKEEASILVNSQSSHTTEATSSSSMEPQSVHIAGMNRECSHVINVASWHESFRGEKMLREKVRSLLAAAAHLDKTSVTLTVIGALVFAEGLSPETASQITIEEAMGFSHVNQNCSITRISVVVFTEDHQRTKTMFAQEMPFMQRSSGPDRSLVRIHVKQGDITAERTDAIVNINSTDMNMKHAGVLSAAVAKASGPAVQMWCKMAGKQKPGAAVLTPGGKLPAAHIIHSVPGSADKRHLQECVESCLRRADLDGFSSVSLPTFGTGGFGKSAQYSSELMFDALENFCPTSKNVREVNIVIFQPQMVPVFKKEQRERAKKSATVRRRDSSSDVPSRLSHLPEVRPANMLASRTSTEDGGKATTFYVVGEDEEHTRKACEALRDGFSAEYKCRTVEDKAVSLLTAEEVVYLSKRAACLDVSLTAEADKISIRGNLSDVKALVKDVSSTIDVIKEEERLKEHAKILSRTVQWKYCKDSGVENCFDKESNLQIEAGFTKDEGHDVNVFLLGETYSINFRSKTGFGEESGDSITVRREIVGVEDKGIPLPSNWVPMPRNAQSGNEETVHLERLASLSSEYREVLAKIHCTHKTLVIRSIDRVQNPVLYQAYQVRKKKMDRDNGTRNNERQLFHGTAAQNVPKINTQGFNRSFAGSNVGKAYGAGVYFARDASYSTGYAQGTEGLRCLYIARVLVGDSALGKPEMMVPPPRNASRPEITFDSTVDRIRSPRIFVVFYDNQCYPEYLIRF